MESFLNRYRNITILLLVIFGQLLLLAVQVKNDRDVRMIRVWSVTAVTPLARTLEAFRSGTVGFVREYILLKDAHDENRKLQEELDKLKIENQFLRTELSTAERAKALAAFQSRTPSKTLAARVIAIGAGSSSKVVLVDRGTASGVQRGMGVVTPDGIVGKVWAAYPVSSQVQLVTDADFAAGVISQKHQVRGTLKGQGYGACKVDYVQNEEPVDPGEWFYTSGDDRIFPKGFPVGTVRVVRPGQGMKDIYVDPSGLQHGLEEVLILLEAVPQAIPDAPPANAPVYLAPAPPPDKAAQAQPNPDEPAPARTEADKLLRQYKAIGDAQNHKFGEGLPGSKPPDFNLTIPGEGGAAKPAAAPAAGQPAAAKPAPGTVETGTRTIAPQTPAGVAKPAPGSGQTGARTVQPGSGTAAKPAPGTVQTGTKTISPQPKPEPQQP